MKSEHDLELSAPKEVNYLDQTVEKGGICSPCHAVHHAPQRQILWTRSAVLNIYYPLYDKRGNKTPTGFVTCTTCHNPHQWDPLTKYYPEKKNIEGDPTNSFLRNRGPAFSICLDCPPL